MSYQIKCTPNYHKPVYSVPQAHLVCTDDSNTRVATWDTKDEAEEIAEAFRKGGHTLSKSEVEPPTYEVIKDFDIGPDCIKGVYEHEIEATAMPRKILDKLDSAVVVPLCWYDNSYVTCSYCAGSGNKKYCVYYTVNTITLQLNAITPTWINLHKPTYVCFRTK